MIDFEIEDGEAYFFQDDDDDEKIDPDRDFSYIDKKIENILGQDQKDFMSGLSAESLGARYGGYGSFLPMQQRSPPILSNQKSQSHVMLKSPQDLPSESSHQNPANAANHSLPTRSIPASADQHLEAMSDTGISSVNNQSKIQSSGELASNHQNKKMMIHPEKNSLKFRVKMASENISRLDKSAIYSGLGLDMSPTSSPEDSPTENDENSIGLQETNLDSPSSIVKIMTTIPLSSNELLSPLQDSLVDLKGMENSLGTGLPGNGEACPVNTIPESNYLKGKKEARMERKSMVRDATKVKKSKHKEAIEEKPTKQSTLSQKSVDLVKENSEYPANIIAMSATKREENGALTAKEIVSSGSIDAVGSFSEEKENTSWMNKNTGFKPLNVFDKKNEAVCLVEDIDNPMKQIHLAWHKTKEESGSAKKLDAVEDDVNATTLRGKIEKDKNFAFRSESSSEKVGEIEWREDEVDKSCKQHAILKDKVKQENLDSTLPKYRNANLIPKSESTTGKRNEGRGNNVLNKFPKQHNMVKDKVKEEVLDSPCPIDSGKHRKENIIVEKNIKDEEVEKYNDVPKDMKYDNGVTLEPLKQKPHPREMTVSQAEQEQKPRPREMTVSQAEQALRCESDIVVNKKLKGSQVRRVSAAEPPRGSSVDGSSAANSEVVVSKNIPSKGKKGDSDPHREKRKCIEGIDKGEFRKKGKGVNSKDLVMGVSEQEAPVFKTKMKDKSKSNKPSLASNGGSDMENLGGANLMVEKVGDVPPAEIPAEAQDDWVECEKCHKWRLLPLGMSSDPLREKEWTCSMIDWLPGMNSCKYTEDETTNARQALYMPVDPAQLQNNQPVYINANASVNLLAGAQNVTLPNQATRVDALSSVGKKRNLAKTEIDAAQPSGFQALHVPVKKDQRHPGVTRNTKNLNKFPRESDSARKSGDGKPVKIEKKRVADVDAYGLPKKIKRARQQPVEDYDHGTLRVAQDFAKGSSKYPLVKAKGRTQSNSTSMDEEMYDVSGKKRKLKDKQHRVAVPSGRGNIVKNGDVGQNSDIEYRKEKKSKSSSFHARESDKQHQKSQSENQKSNLVGAVDSSLHQGGRPYEMPMEQYRGDRVVRKTPGGRTASEMALDLGLSDNATTSSSSKISCKVKAKVHGAKSSPVASISSSPIKLLKSDLDKGANKKNASYSEQHLKSGGEGSTNEFGPHYEGLRDRKSNLSRNYIVSDTADEEGFGKEVPSGKHSTSHAIFTELKLEDKDTGCKVNPTYEGTTTSLHNLVTENEMAKSLIKLPSEGTNFERGKLRVSKINGEKEVSSNSHGFPDLEGGVGSIGGRVDSVNEKPFRQVAIGHTILRPAHHSDSGHVSNDIEASSSRRKDIVHGAAKTALKEAKDLKHSATRLKVAGSGLESTGIFFQAALKFLHGASLLESGNIESGDTVPNEVYATTAKYFKNCALEYENCHDMASAALAYKCLEVAYMRMVYCKDLAASRDRQELQKAVKAAPQVDSPSSSASDIDNLNQAAIDTVKDGQSAMDHRSHIVSAENRPNLEGLLDFTRDVNLAMEASRSSQIAFAAAMPVFRQAGNEEGISSVKSVLDFSFHDVDGFLHLVRLAMESIKS